MRSRSRSNSLRSNRSNSFSSADGSHKSQGSGKKTRSKHVDGKLPPPILVYHENAHSIVFRDHLRRVAKRQGSSNLSRSDSKHEDPQRQVSSASSQHSDTSKPKKNAPVSNTEDSPRRDTFIEVATEFTHMVGMDNGETVMPSQAQIPSDQIANFQPQIQPLPLLALGPDDQFGPLAQQVPVLETEDSDSDIHSDWSPAEKEVVGLLQTEKACVKTVRNGDWTAFLTRFQQTQSQRGKWSTHHMDIAPHDGDDFPFNSFVTSTSLLPPSGKKMRCFGAINQYTVGVVFALPNAFQNPNDKTSETEAEACDRTKTWSWPAGCTST